MFRFTIRELVLLTLVAAMGVGWWLDHFQSDDRLVEWKAHAMEKVLADEGWVVEQNGWEVQIGRVQAPHPHYRFGVKLPE